MRKSPILQQARVSTRRRYLFPSELSGVPFMQLMGPSKFSHFSFLFVLRLSHLHIKSWLGIVVVMADRDSCRVMSLTCYGHPYHSSSPSWVREAPAFVKPWNGVHSTSSWAVHSGLGRAVRRLDTDTRLPYNCDFNEAAPVRRLVWVKSSDYRKEPMHKTK